MRKIKNVMRDITESYSAKAIIRETMSASLLITLVIFMFFDIKEKIFLPSNKKSISKDIFYDMFQLFLFMAVCGMCFSGYRIYKNLYQDVNATQKNIIESFLKPFLDDIDSLSREDAIKTLEIILDTNNVDTIYQQSLLSPEIRALASQISQILMHPCPQNRTTSCHPLLERGNFIAFKDIAGNICYEQRGLLSLTAYIDHTSKPISREATVAYIRDLIAKKQMQLIVTLKQDHPEQMQHVNQMSMGR